MPGDELIIAETVSAARAGTENNTALHEYLDRFARLGVFDFILRQMKKDTRSQIIIYTKTCSKKKKNRKKKNLAITIVRIFRKVRKDHVDIDDVR